MTRKSRFLKSVIAASQNAKLTLPWARTTCVVIVSPEFGSTLDFSSAGMNLQALPWEDTSTT